MRYSLLAAAGIVSVALAGCGGGATVNTRNDMEVSKAAYQFCLAQHPQAPQTCDSARASYDAGLKAYRDTSVGALGRGE